MTEDYRITRGKALIVEKKRVAKNPQKNIGLPSKKNVVGAAKQIGGALLLIAGPGKVVKGAKVAAKGAKAVKFAAQRANFSRGTTKVAPILKKKAAIKVGPKSSVKVVNPQTDAVRASKNYASTMKVTGAKSGNTAKLHSALSSAGNSAKRPGILEKGFVETQRVKSGGNVKPATLKVTKANTSAGVGKAPSKNDAKWDMEKAKLSAKKGKTVKINSK